MDDWRKSRNARRLLEKENEKRPTTLSPVPRESWPGYAAKMSAPPVEVWVSRAFLVQVFAEENGVERMTVNRTTINPSGRWVDGITFDELFRLKREIGRGDKYAVEVYPAEVDLVDDANMRHLWILPAPLPLGWFPATGKPGGAIH